jgi:hypothetical protein
MGTPEIPERLVVGSPEDWYLLKIQSLQTFQRSDRLPSPVGVILPKSPDAGAGASTGFQMKVAKMNSKGELSTGLSDVISLSILGGEFHVSGAGYSLRLSHREEWPESAFIRLLQLENVIERHKTVLQNAGGVDQELLENSAGVIAPLLINLYP